MTREYSCQAYRVLVHPDGVELYEPITGYRVRRSLFSEAVSDMHRQLIARLDDLRARGRDALTAQERDELDGLVATLPESFLRAGIAA